jgi:calcium-dependent protein kinase
MINPDVLVEKSSKSPFDYYTIISKIKESFNDEVLKVKNIITGYDCVMKQIIKRHNTTITEEMEIINEIEMMKKLDHPNLIKIFQFFSTPESYFIIMENCEGGELYDEIIKNGPFNEDQAAFILYQMFSAIFYCHSNNIIHRDLKPENIVIEKKEENRYLRIKIADFGASKIYEKGRIERKIVGSSYYIAPEVLKKNYNEKCDLWSCGVILYILLSARPPFNGENDQEILENVIKGKYDLNSPPFDNITNEAKSLISSLLIIDPVQRISASQALEDPWFKKNSTKQKLNKIFINPQNEKLIEKFLTNLKSYKSSNVLQQASLAYIVHNFPQLEEIENCNKFFNYVDLNGDGKITKEELLHSLVEFTGYNKEDLEQEVKNIFNNIDYNQNGYVELEEFVSAAIDKKDILTDNFLKFAFRFFDKNNIGFITLNDIKSTFDSDENNKYNPDLEKQLNVIIDDVDLNKDGKISFEEFKLMMAKLLKSF